jgi:hypothetical protein
MPRSAADLAESEGMGVWVWRALSTCSALWSLLVALEADEKLGGLSTRATRLSLKTVWKCVDHSVSGSGSGSGSN